VVRAISPEQLRTIDTPEHYLGAAEALRIQLLSAHEPRALEP